MPNLFENYHFMLIGDTCGLCAGIWILLMSVRGPSKDRGENTA